MKKTRYHSWCLGELPNGCKMCVKGRKTVLFITGLCSKHCFYCPISDQKWQKDVVYANEMKTKNFDDLVKEIRLCSSQGVGITGGDPLVKINRTALYIKRLKKIFGRKFHIHLYTPLNLVDENKLRVLYYAGLDEIRFNPDLDNAKLWKRIDLAEKYDWDIGAEIPVIPGYLVYTKKMIDYIDGKVGFLNLNELEISDTNCNELLKRGYKAKDSLSYAVKGSQELAFKLLKYIEAKKYKLKVHYCTATLKDKVQLRKRIKLRARNHATRYDKITTDGTIKRIVVYLDELKPGMGYEQKLKKVNTKLILQKLMKINKQVDGIIDKNRLRIIINKKMVAKAKKIKKISIAKVEEYPTHDAMLIKVGFI